MRLPWAVGQAVLEVLRKFLTLQVGRRLMGCPGLMAASIPKPIRKDNEPTHHTAY